MPGASYPRLVRNSACAIVVAMLGQGFVCAQQFGAQHDGDQRWPVYQRRAFDWTDKRGHGEKFGRRHFPHSFAPQVSSGWFQRPYPYHLDYYKMRYGGSYAPYFGNLYGPPQVVTAPPYYGPYYGNYVSGDPNAYAPGGVQPGYPTGPVFEGPIEEVVPDGQTARPSINESLPSP
jgi:hypothetical protein